MKAGMELYGRRSGTESDQQQVEWAPAGQEPGLVGGNFELISILLLVFYLHCEMLGFQ